MAAERDAACPNCSAVRRVRCPARTVVSCVECGFKFRAPAEPAPAPEALPTPEPAAVGTAGPAGVGSAAHPSNVEGVGSTGVKVVRASKPPKIAQNARPRARGTGLAAVADEPAEPEPIPAQPLDPVPSHPQSARARESGRRGGLASAAYRAKVRGR